MNCASLLNLVPEKILLNNLTNSRSSLMLDKTFDIKTLSLYTEDATQKTIQWLEEELKKLKEKIPS